jgi:hypothetical protein
MLSHENLCSNIQSISGNFTNQARRETALDSADAPHLREHAGLNYLLYCGGCICSTTACAFHEEYAEWQIES